MKEGIHPNYEQTTIKCACGNVIETGSTKKDIRVEVCSKCHPFFTGKQKMVDTGGRVSRFNKKFGLDKVLVETPSYMHFLVAQGLMDELFFNYSCIYVGGQALTIGKFGREFGSKDHPHTRMLSIHTHSDHFFYFRHKLIYG